MATAQKRGAQILGFIPAAADTTKTFALSAAGSWLALAFVPARSKTIAKAKVYCSAAGVTVANITCSATLYTDVAGIPGTAISSPITIAAGNWPAAGNFVEFAGWTDAVTAGVRYWIVIKNLSAAPTVDYPTIRIGGTNTVDGAAASANYGWAKRQTTDGGTTWTSTAYYSNWGLLITYSDDSVAGWDITDEVSGANWVYGYSGNIDRRVGASFTTPDDAILNIAGLAMLVSSQGNPSGDVKFALYSGATLLGTTNTIPKANISTPVIMRAYFAETVTVQPGTSLRAVIQETVNNDVSSNRFQTYEFTIPADSIAVPMGARLVYWDGSTWTTTPTKFCAFGLILDTDDEFGTPAGGEGGGNTYSRAAVVNGD
jgi:hypothetical protein